MMNVQAVARLITMGIGAGVLPGHYVARRGKDDLYLFEGSGKALKNTISIAYLRERTHSTVTRATIDFLKRSLEKRGRSFSKKQGP